MEFLGYIAASVIGITLGLIGGGGSILTVPVLVYLFGLPATTATGYSLFIVGATALIGASNYVREKLIDYRVAAAFGIPSIASVFLTRNFLVPAIPDPVGPLAKDRALLVLFAILMVAAAVSMLKKGKPKADDEAKPNLSLIAVQGLMVGVVTGMLGAGGGFLIIPALVMLAKLEMKTAIGTSLLIIATNTLLGFLGSIGTLGAIDWNLILTITGIAAVGTFVGAYIGKFVSGAKLKPAFGVFILAMGAYIIARELIL